MDPIDALIGLCSVCPILYVSCLAHEVGHALMGRAAGFAVASFGMGIGRPWAVISVGRTRIFLCVRNPFQGIAFCFHPRLYPPRMRMILMLAGGIIANGSLAMIPFALGRLLPRGWPVWIGFFLVNAALAIGSVIPYRFRVGGAVLQTDGMLILKLICDGVIRLPGPVIIQTVETLRGLWESIGDHLSLHVYLVAAAAARLELGDPERAGLLLAEATALDVRDTSTSRAVESLIEAALATATGRALPAAEALHEAESRFQTVGDEEGLLMVAIERADARLCEHDTAAALAAIDALLTDPRTDRDPELRSHLLASRLQACIAKADAVGAHEALTRYEASCGRHRSLTRDLRVYKAMAGLHATREDWPRAATCYRKGAQAINSLLTSWPAIDEQRRFLERQASFLDGARRCFLALNEPEEADRLVDPILSAEEIQERVDELHRNRQRRLVRAARLTCFVNMLCMLVTFGIGALLRGDGRRVFYTLAGEFALCTIPVIFYLLFRAALGGAVPRVGYVAGAIFLVLACIPWLTLLAVIVAIVSMILDANL
jgi:hypothetical protein